MLTVMPGPYEVMVSAMPMTDDGFVEVLIEMNGRVVSSDVVDDMGHDALRAFIDRLLDEVQRRC